MDTKKLDVLMAIGVIVFAVCVWCDKWWEFMAICSGILFAAIAITSFTIVIARRKLKEYFLLFAGTALGITMTVLAIMIPVILWRGRV